jgi:hypothetical protein
VNRKGCEQTWLDSSARRKRGRGRRDGTSSRQFCAKTLRQVDRPYSEQAASQECLTARRALISLRQTRALCRRTNGREATLHPGRRDDTSRVYRALPASEPPLHGHGLCAGMACEQAMELSGCILRVVWARGAAGDGSATRSAPVPRPTMPCSACAGATLRAIRSSKPRRLPVVCTRFKCTRASMHVGRRRARNI